MFFVTSLHLGLYLYLVFFLLQSLRHGIRRATSLYTSEARARINFWRCRENMPSREYVTHRVLHKGGVGLSEHIVCQKRKGIFSLRARG